MNIKWNSITYVFFYSWMRWKGRLILPLVAIIFIYLPSFAVLWSGRRQRMWVWTLLFYFLINYHDLASYEPEKKLHAIQQWMSSFIVESDKRVGWYPSHTYYYAIYQLLRSIIGEKVENLGEILILFSIQLFNLTLK